MFDEKTIEIFSSRDNIRNQLIEYTKSYLELENLELNQTDYLSYLINLLSVLTANLIYYSSSTYREMFLTKAMQRESVLNLSAMLGYKPPWATAATTSVLVAIPLKFTGSVSFVIPEGQKYYAGDVTFTQNNSIQIDVPRDQNGNIISVAVTEEADVLTVIETLPVGGSRALKWEINTVNGVQTLYFLANVTQQTNQTIEFTVPELRSYEFYTLPLTFEGQLSEIEEVISSEWVESNSMFLIPYGTKGYVFRHSDAGGKIFFGNNIIGTQPPTGVLNTIKIAITNGASGNVIAGSINRTDTLYVKDYDSRGNTIDAEGSPYIMKPVSPTVVNIEPATGGADLPTMDQIRTAAINNLTARNRLVSSHDYANINSIVEDIPTYHATSVLKQSDIKNNEIALFTDLIFEETIVPIRNAVWEIDTTGDLVNSYIYTRNTIEIDGSDYYSMFNIVVRPSVKECDYYYLANTLELATVLNRSKEGLTEVLPSYSIFDVVIQDSTTGSMLPETSQRLDITLHYDILVEGADTNLQCLVETTWDGRVYNMVKDTDTDGNNIFKVPTTNPIPLTEVPDLIQTYLFKMYYLIDDPNNPGETMVDLPYLNESQVQALIKQQLDEYMYSQVIVDTTNNANTIKVYDVPVIKKTYYDGINQSNFALLVYNKILELDITEYRMLTDFINLKFSNTTGIMDNMKYNKATKNSVISINPHYTLEQLASDSTNGDRYLIVEETCEDGNPWADAPYNREGGFIAEYVSVTNNWIFERLSVNDIVEVTSTGDKIIFNGADAIVPVTTIPFSIQIIVWIDRTTSVSTDAVIKAVKDNLINGLYTRFGFDADIYKSDLLQIIQSTAGVLNSQIIEPRHDIFFNYDVRKDLTQQELLEYSPQLIWFDSTTITVEVR